MMTRTAHRVLVLLVLGIFLRQSPALACTSGFVGCAAASSVCTGINSCDVGPHYVYYTGNNPQVGCTMQSVCVWCTGECAFCANVNFRIVTDCDDEILEYNGDACCRDWWCCPI
jgi:hypothetical protein